MQQLLLTTPSQTVGPFFAYSLTAKQYGYNYDSIVDGNVVTDEYEGKRIYIQGNIYDGQQNPVTDAVIELWQADENGKYQTENIININFKGFARLGTGTNNHIGFHFTSIKPGIINNEAPHIHVMLMMRGSLHVLHTRLYFDDENNETDPLFQSIEKNRQHTLLAKHKNINGNNIYEYNIFLQGENEIVFFDVT